MKIYPNYRVLDPIKYKHGTLQRFPSSPFTLYWPEDELFMVSHIPDKMLRGKYDNHWNPDFRENSPIYLSKTVAERRWMAYEFIRLKHKTGWPTLEVVQARRKIVHDTCIRPQDFGLRDYLGLVYGKVMGEHLVKLPEGWVPLYALKRQGRTIKMADDISDSVFSVGVYSFFDNADDLFLMKIKLGSNIAQEYDFRNSIDEFNRLSA